MSSQPAPEEPRGFRRGDCVKSRRFGAGTVQLGNGATVIVRFEHGLEECLAAELVLVEPPEALLRRCGWQPPLEAVTRLQAEAIRSINDTWGVFARSQIDLLPHQLWVCRRVCERWPFRWLVADDVGLGKTIEAGLILSSLLPKELVRRLLIICPASLVDQWQQRMRTMFDIRASVYATEVDRPGRDFWNTHQRVIASLETLRADTKERHQRLIESDAWDLVIVDEAHRLGADEKTGATLAYGLLERLLQHELVKSMLFFTGTPHRGKNYGFLALLQLLRPDLFDPERPPGQQLPKLREVMIRNNKHTVTDLQGKLLFHPPDIEPRTYAYSPDEARFYDMLTEFISSGKAYASTLGGFNGRAVMLVLVSMQKLASSSVAAIRRALKGRLARVGDADFAREKLEMLKEALAKLELSRSEGEEDDLASGLDEQVSAQSAQLALMGDERDRLVELVAAADAVVSETKIQAIVDFVAALPAERSVLFFTEYKATQALLMSALLARFGEGCVTFINGDGRIEGVRGRDKRELSRSEDRASAADRFNAGRVRFLVSTEAGGEGIDLQQSCFTLVHVDLPWNPMRLHQRVGRLNRYGQHQTVKVTLFRNPDTVEGRIWDLLNEKLQRINGALRGAMDEPEDMLQLVLGMTSPALFQELYADAPPTASGRLDDWFDQKTARLGGRDVLDAVRDVVGLSVKFNFGEAAADLPRVDLADLRPFFLNSLTVNHRRAHEDAEGLAFRTPDAWTRHDPAVLESYRGLHFERNRPGRAASDRLLGVGHRLVGHALKEGLAFSAGVACVAPDLIVHPVFVYRVQDRVTGDTGTTANQILAMRIPETGSPEVLRDWELLRLLNAAPAGQWSRRWASDAAAQVREAMVVRATEACTARLQAHPGSFRVPTAALIGVLWPGSKAAPDVAEGGGEGADLDEPPGA